MALGKCRECGHQMAKSAAACPSCGAKNRRTKWSTWVLTAFFALMVGLMLRAQQSAQQMEQALSPEQRAQVAKEREQEGRRLEFALSISKAVRAAARDPDSIQWDTLMVDAEGTTGCLIYRARNGFGGMNIANVTIVGGRFDESAGAWNKNCAGKNLFDASIGLR